MRGWRLKIRSDDFRLKPGRKKLDLSEWPTVVDPFFTSKDEYQQILAGNVEALNSLQQLHYASSRHALLLIFQGMDSAGKDGVIRHILTGINPAGCEVHSFKQPSSEELSHDFLWRTTCKLPARGRIGVFNRSYYEEVLVVRVHPELLIAENLRRHSDDSLWRDRYRSIVEFEAHMGRNGTKIVKFFLHLSKKEQAKRFLSRIDEPDKNWKFSQADIHERTYWRDYMRAYQECLAATSTKRAPWFVVPADDKANARLIASQILLDEFAELKMAYPKTGASRRRELHKIRTELTK
jgi:PPK2 family polyphosphate:nucleotide phosphotransferase